tara:strand:- start:341 stop:679 length:339 start_codon:yes stop_codon:yes gene_type:complete
MDKEEELSYEEEQLQLILFNEMKEKKREEDRAFKEAQTKEYLDALKIDEEKELKDKDKVKEEVKDKVKEEVKDKVKDLKDRVKDLKEENKVTDDEVSVEEMRRIRLLRFQNK